MSVHAPPQLYFEPLKLLVYEFNADPDSASKYNADPCGSRSGFAISISTSSFVLHCKKRLAVFPSPAGMSLAKLYLEVKNLVIPGQGEFGW